MNLHEAYDLILEDTTCPVCSCVGMLPDGDYDYLCPNCGYEGSLSDEDDEDEDEDD